MSYKILDRVMQKSSTAGAGDLTLSGSITGYRTFSSALLSGDTFPYAAVEVDGSGNPSGDWETGVGKFNGAALVRVRVFSSSNGDSLVNFAATTKNIFIGLPATIGANIKEPMINGITSDFYVRTDGSDSNDGLGDSPDRAFQTLQGALFAVTGSYTIPYGVTAKIHLPAGTLSMVGALLPFDGDGILEISGVSNASTILSLASGNVFYTPAATRLLSRYRIKTLKVVTSTGYGIFADNGANVEIIGLSFGACGAGHIYAGRQAKVFATNYYEISGAAPSHIVAEYGGMVEYAPWIEVTHATTPTYSTAFATLRSMSIFMTPSSTTFYGSAAGSRYNISQGALAVSNGKTFPGTSAGTTATGGQFV